MKFNLKFILRFIGIMLVLTELTTTPLKAQINIDSTILAINNNLRATFGNLAGTSYSNKNYHMAIHQVPEDRFTTYSDSIEDFDIWYNQYFEMYYTALDTTVMPRYDSLYSISSQSKEDTVPILIQNFNFHKFRDSLVFQSDTFFVFDTVNNVLYDKPNRPYSPYVAGGIFKGTNFKKAVSFADPVFKIDPQLIVFDTYTAADFTETQLQIDFGDGQGFITINTLAVNYIPVTYSSDGWKTITYRIYDALNNVVLKKSKSRIYVQNHITAASLNLIDTLQNIEGLDIMVKKGCEEMPHRPLILLTGFDFNNDIGHGKWYYDFFRDGQLNDAIDYGYDLYIVKYDKPNRSIPTNALKVVKLIEHLKCTTYVDSEEQFVMVGIGLGALVGRYALTWMENPANYNGESCKPNHYHNTRLFISMDGPHQGYNIPLSLQYLFKDSPRMVPRMGANRERLEDYRKKVIDSPMGKQLLIYHIDSKNGKEYERHIDGINFFNQLNNLGSYPKYCKKIGIANGMGNGDHQTHDVTHVPQPDHSTLIYGGSKLRFYILFFSFTLWESTYRLYTNPPGGTAHLIDQEAQLKIPRIKPKIFGLKIISTLRHANIDKKGKKLHATGSAQGGYQGMGYIGIDPDPVQLKNSFDWAAGGLQLSFLQSGEPAVNASGSILGMEFMNSGTAYSDGYRFSFIPTVSAIDKTFNWDDPNLARINDRYIHKGSYMAVMGTWFDVISMGAPAPNWPYETQHTNDVIWSIQQNNNHNSKIRNENVTSQAEFGWLLDEIGTKRLNLENYSQNWSATFKATEEINLTVGGNNAYYQYPGGPAPLKMKGTFSKQEPYIINSGAIPTFEVGVGGNFYDFPWANHGQYSPIYKPFDVCNQYQGYAHKKGTAPAKEEPETLEILVFPNPGEEHFNVKLNTDLYTQLQVITITGKQIYSTPIFNNQLKIATTNWPKGMYLIQLSGANKTKSIKWIK